MGICGEDKLEKEEKEKTIQVKTVTAIMKSICKITKEKAELLGIGFFINAPNKLNYLITNSLKINPESIKNYNYITIEIWNKKKMQLNLNERGIKFFKKEKDLALMEIKTSYEIYKDIYLLECEPNYMNKGPIIYKDKEIFTIKNPFGKDTEYIKGKIINISDHEFEHNILIDSNNSGYPILLNNNLNSLVVVGIQKNINNSNKSKNGVFIGELLKDLNKDINKEYNQDIKKEFNKDLNKEINKDLNKQSNKDLNKESNKDLNKENFNKDSNTDKSKAENYITAEIFIKDKEVEDEIRIINSYEEYMRKYYPDEKLEESEKNEEEITKCEIKINEQIIPFKYFHKFNKSGKYIIKYYFKNELNKTNLMFGECHFITKIDLSNFISQNIINMSWMFGGCNSLINIDLNNFNSQNVINMSGMLYECKSLSSITLSNFNTQNSTNMENMFKGCESLKEIDLNSFNTSKVIFMNGMFDGCKSLSNLNLSNFNTQNVTDMSGMFYECKSLTDINLSNFNTQNVTNMSCMFNECESLIKIKISNFNTQNVKNIYCMFRKCKSLKSLDLSNFDTRNVSDMVGLFYGCDSLTNINISNFNTEKVTDMTEIFFGCKSLSSIDLSKFNTQNVISMRNIFGHCSKLKKENVKTSDERIIQELRGC